MRKTKFLALILVVPALALTACGGGDKKSSDEDQITSIVNTVAKDPAKLCDYASKDLLQQAFKGSVAECKKAAASEKSDGAATIDSLDVKGDKATAKITDKAGSTTVNFVKEDSKWVVAS
jgi:hypothetical protein